MINKITIEEMWKKNPQKIYYAIQNPTILKKQKKLIGIDIICVPYQVISWDNKNIKFKQLNKINLFPAIIFFDKQFYNAENEIILNKDLYDDQNLHFFDTTYAIFKEEKIANYNKLSRLHALALKLTEMHNSLKNHKKVSITHNSHIDLTIQDIKNFFEEIQNTNYFDELLMIQTQFPDLSTM